MSYVVVVGAPAPYKGLVVRAAIRGVVVISDDVLQKALCCFHSFDLGS